MAVICLVLPLFCVQVSAAVIPVSIEGLGQAGINTDVNAAIGNANTGDIINVTGTGTNTGVTTILVNKAVQINWNASSPNGAIYFDLYTAGANLIINGNFNGLAIGGTGNNTVTITGNSYIGTLAAMGEDTIILAGSAVIGSYDVINDQYNHYDEYVSDRRGQSNNNSPAGEDEPDTRGRGDEFTLYDVLDEEDDDLTFIITDDEPLIKDGIEYAGIVDIKNFFTDDPEEIPKEVIIDGKRYLVGNTIYIVGIKNLEIVGYTETGVSYVFPAVENSDNPATFKAIGLPRGVVLSEDGVLSTAKLPLRVGIYRFSVTVDNGLDSHTIYVNLNIKSGYASDDDLIDDLTQHDKEDQPKVLDDEDETPDGGIPRLWMNEEFRLHYLPDLKDFDELFLDGKLLKSGEDYRAESGSTVIILTEQTMAPLPTGDHVVTTMFHQNSDVGMDTVINDVGGSSFVFRFGDGKTEGKRINIGGDGVTGSVTFDDKSGETPITTISANTEAINQRANNLSNATGCEIIAAFETKQTGGFGGKTATFAVSVKSLDLTLKNGTAVYIAVYDSKTGKTYQNKGEVKDGMIVFRTQHSGVFMISLKKY
jgi:hypothetical protein